MKEEGKIILGGVFLMGVVILSINGFLFSSLLSEEVIRRGWSVAVFTSAIYIVLVVFYFFIDGIKKIIQKNHYLRGSRI